MSVRNPPADPFLDLAADAAATKRDYQQAERDLAELRTKLRSTLKRASTDNVIGEDDAERIAGLVAEGSFERARMEYRQAQEER